MNRLAYTGTNQDPVAALLFCQPQQVDLSVINGRIIVQNGQLTTLDLQPTVQRHNTIARTMFRGE